MSPQEIRDLRANLGLSQRQLAEKVGVTPNAVQHWEYGLRRPSSAAEKTLTDLRDD